MTFLPWPHPILRRPAAPVGEITGEVRGIWDAMERAMRAMPGARGVGLAAPQIGHGVALAILDAGPEPAPALRLADPEILWSSPETSVHEESSPNLPGARARIRRPPRVRAAFTGPDGERSERLLEGLWATSLQHQIDHLQGRLFFHRLSRTRRDMLLRRARRLSSDTARGAS